jgi:hypothetical protein
MQSDIFCYKQHVGMWVQKNVAKNPGIYSSINPFVLCYYLCECSADELPVS